MYVKKIAVFASSDWEFEKFVNKFLAREKELGLIILDIQYQFSKCHTCLVYYMEPIKDN